MANAQPSTRSILRAPSNPEPASNLNLSGINREGPRNSSQIHANRSSNHSQRSLPRQHSRNVRGNPSRSVTKTNNNKKKSAPPSSKDFHCECAPDFFTRVLGPTADESILKSLQTFYDLYSQMAKCGQKSSVKPKEGVKFKSNSYISPSKSVQQNDNQSNLISSSILNNRESNTSEINRQESTPKRPNQPNQTNSPNESNIQVEEPREEEPPTSRQSILAEPSLGERDDYDDDDDDDDDEPYEPSPEELNAEESSSSGTNESNESSILERQPTTVTQELDANGSNVNRPDMSGSSIHAPQINSSHVPGPLPNASQMRQPSMAGSRIHRPEESIASSINESRQQLRPVVPGSGRGRIGYRPPITGPRIAENYINALGPPGPQINAGSHQRPPINLSRVSGLQPHGPMPSESASQDIDDRIRYSNNIHDRRDQSLEGSFILESNRSAMNSSVPQVVTEILESAVGLPPEVASEIVQTSFSTLLEKKPSLASKILQTSTPQMISQILETIGLSPEMADDIVQTSLMTLQKENPSMYSKMMQTSVPSLRSEFIQTSNRSNVAPASSRNLNLISKSEFSEGFESKQGIFESRDLSGKLSNVASRSRSNNSGSSQIGKHVSYEDEDPKLTRNKMCKCCQCCIPQKHTDYSECKCRKSYLEDLKKKSSVLMNYLAPKPKPKCKCYTTLKNDSTDLATGDNYCSRRRCRCRCQDCKVYVF